MKGCLANQKSSSIGTYLDVVINEQSARKTPNLMGFDSDGDRILGDAALPLLFRSPAKVFAQVKRLLGRTFEDPVTQQFQADFPALKLKADPERGTVVFTEQQGGDLSVEEIVVMLLQNSKRQAENHVKANAEPEDQKPLDDVVVSVPENWTAAQRTLFEQLVQLSGFNVPKATVNELTAVAIDYAVRNLPAGEGEASKQRIVFVQSGTMAVSASLIEMERTAADGGIAIKVLSTASDQSLGGYSYDVVLRDALSHKFDALHQKGGASIQTNPRAMAKLLREARELKEMLSVSPMIESAMEELFNGKDFKTQITQEEFTQMTRDLTQKFLEPVRQVITSAAGSAGAIHGIEIFGGCVRIPSIQNALRTAFPEIPLGKHVDGEEAVVLGAAHYAGVLTGVSKLTKVTVDESATAPVKTASDSKLTLSSTQQALLASKIAALDAKAAARHAADAARNALESTVNEARELVGGKVPKEKKTAAEEVEQLANAASTFVDDSDKSTTAADFDTQRERLLTAMSPLRAPKPAAPAATNDKPSKPKKKRDRRAEYAKAQAEQAKRDKEKKAKEEKRAKEQQERQRKEKEAKAKNTRKAEQPPKKDAKKDNKKPAAKKPEPTKKDSNKKRDEL